MTESLDPWNALFLEENLVDQGDISRIDVSRLLG